MVSILPQIVKQTLNSSFLEGDRNEGTGDRKTYIVVKNSMLRTWSAKFFFTFEQKTTNLIKDYSSKHPLFIAE